MEIFDFLHLTTRRLIAIVCVALLAGATTAAVLVSDSTDSYEAEAIVFLGQVLPADRSTFAVAPFAGDLEVLLSLDPTRQDVATASGVDSIPVTDLSTRQISNGTAVGIRAIASTPALAETLAAEAARVGLSTLLEQERNRAQRNLEAVNRQLLEVRADLEQFRGDNDTVDPVFEFRAAADERLSLQVELSDPQLTDANREVLEDQRRDLDAEILRLGALQAPYNELDRALLGAEGAMSDAKQEVAAADALLAGAASGDFVVTTPAAAISNQSTIRAGVAASMIVVVLLSLGLFVRMDRRRSNEHQVEVPEPESSGQPVDQQWSDPEHDAVAAEVSDPGTEHSSPEDTSTSSPPAAHTATETADALACVCGRVCRSAQGLSAHQRSCKTFRRSRATDRSENDDSDSETSDDDAHPEPTAATNERSGAPVRVLISQFGASDDQEHSSNRRVLKQALEAAGLNEGESFTIVDARGDGFTQVRQAEQAIDDGVSVILLVGSDPDTTATIVNMAEKAGVEIVEQSALGARFTAPGAVNGNAVNHHGIGDAINHHAVDDELLPAGTVGAAGLLLQPTPRWAPAGNDRR